ncbi:MAG: hypothetical protein QGD90_02690, partial [Candidatus Hydrogenedentes bacterium]|nr:hypothetical protein [Candidatus Hydrogenedentota bacterium]
MTSKRTQTIQMVLITATMCLAAFEWSYAQQSPTRPGQRGPGLSTGRDAGRPAAGRAPARGRPTRGAGADVSVVSGGARGAAPSVVGGGQARGTRGGAGADVSVVSGQVGGVAPSVVGLTKGKFEPILRRDVTYGEVPELGDEVVISLAGPMAVPAFLDALALATGWNIAASTDVQRSVLQFWTKEVTPRQAVAVLRFNDIYYEYDEDTQFLFVMTVDEYLQDEYGDLEEREFS